MYSINNKFNGTFHSSIGNKRKILSHELFVSMNKTNQEIKKIHDMTEVDIFSILGLRNLSSFVGEVFVSMLQKVSEGKYIKTPHQDGYPDLLLMDGAGKGEYKKLEREGLLRHKAPFSPFINGGLEVKSTCGDVPSAAVLAKKGLQKPDIGERRLSLLNGYNWKSHHRDTNNLIGIVWDFIDCIPTIVAIFFSSELTQLHWGNIVQPKEGGGRTTSVSIMNKLGTIMMYENWCVIHKDYESFFREKNK